MSAVQKGHELAEQAVLGAVLLDSAALNDVLGVIDETSFCRPEHAAIWQTMVKLFQEGETIDPLVVSKHTPTVSVDYLIDLHGMLGSAQNAPAHARLVAEAAKLRSVERVLQTALKRVNEGVEPAAEIVDLTAGQVIDLANDTVSQGLAPADAGLLEVQQEADEAARTQGASVGLKTGLPDLDRRLRLRDGHLILLAARPSMGKTALALNIIDNHLMHEQTDVAFFSLEMGRLELLQRMVASAGNLNLAKIIAGKLSLDEWRTFTTTVGNLGIRTKRMHVDDSGMLTPVTMRAALRRQRAKGEIGLVVIDYLQLMESSRRYDNRNLEISEISRSLKRLAKEFDVPVLALSQLSREVEKRTARKPQLSDLRESGSLEQDADEVVFIHRDDDRTLLTIGKNRNGPCGEVDTVTFWPQYVKFINTTERSRS